MSKGELLKQSLLDYFNVPSHLEVFTRFTDGDSPVSLRALDWLCTNASKKHNIVYPLRRHGVTTLFNLYVEYKQMLRGLSKKHFDPFCRRQRIEIINSNGQRQQTTVGQLAFIKWASTCGVLAYALEHKAEIEADMLQVSKARCHYESSPEASTPEVDPHMTASTSSGSLSLSSASSSVSPGSSARRHELSTAAIKACTRSVCQVTVRFK